MKGWVKGMLIGAFACVAAGGAICTAGWAMGGRFFYFRDRAYGLMERRPEMVIPAEEFETEASAESSWPARSQAEERAEAVYKGAVIRKLEIQVTGGEVEIVADDSADQVTVVSGNEDYRCYEEADGDKLEVRVKLNVGLWEDYRGKSGGPAAVIRIPAGAGFDQVDLEINGGLLQMDQVTARKLDLEVNAGMLAVTGGNVQQLEGECKMGELTYQGQVGSEMKAECAAGRVWYQIDGKEEDFCYEMESSMGSVLINGDERLAGKREASMDYPGAGKKARLECKTGVIEMEFQ